MVEPDRTLLILNEMRGELRRINIRLDSVDRRLDHEFNELHDRLRRIDERIDGFVTRVEILEVK